MKSKFYIFYDVNGKPLLKTSWISDDPPILNIEHEGVLLTELDDSVSIDSIFIENNKILFKEDRPSNFHVFNYETKSWEDIRNIQTEWVFIRKLRDNKLLGSDWTQLPDVPLPTKEKWAVYRQALRDITQQSDPFNIVWPEPPQ